MKEIKENEIASPLNANTTTRASLIYEKSLTTRSLILALPYVGSSIDLILSTKGQQFIQKRIDTFLEEISRRLDTLESFSIEEKNEEEVFYLLQTVLEKVERTKSELKIERFATLVGNCLIEEKNWDETEVAVKLISDLTDVHMQIIIKMNNLRLSNSEYFKGLKIIQVIDNDIINDIPSLSSELKYLSNAALKMYCSELISRGLLYDEGLGRSGGIPLNLLVPTELAEWLLGRISDR
jgi:HPt (histidine-containing phosphotransfer) domain-containing protein